ncbi:MAG: quinone-dependent dihydroorotate dehydrogenase [Hyphomicrobiaceae bacterium]
MIRNIFGLARPLLFGINPEDAHSLTLSTLERGIHPRAPQDVGQVLHTTTFGLTFPNPVGIAAGFDKNARVADAVLRMGCGFAEIGTITPKQQDGNPKPRIFRLVEDNAVINRLGFNNSGHNAALERLEKRAGRPGIVGVNIGANKDSHDRVADYVAGIKTFAHLADYFTVNISSPNTPGLRDLQAGDALDDLLDRVITARDAAITSQSPRRPVVVKIAPDLSPDELDQTVAQLIAHNVDAIAVSNTTLSRRGLTDPMRCQAGGLSGRPLFKRSTIMLARVYQKTEGKIPLIGIGGIDSGKTAVEKIKAGATLLQLYTGLIYEGPGLIPNINTALKQACVTSGVSSIEKLRGTSANTWAQKTLEA